MTKLTCRWFFQCELCDWLCLFSASCWSGVPPTRGFRAVPGSEVCLLPCSWCQCLHLWTGTTCQRREKNTLSKVFELNSHLSIYRIIKSECSFMKLQFHINSRNTLQVALPGSDVEWCVAVHVHGRQGAAGVQHQLGDVHAACVRRPVQTHVQLLKRGTGLKWRTRVFSCADT